MPKPSGGLAGRMKWLVPRYPKPPGELITLGGILADPEDPETRLNRIVDGDGDEAKKLLEIDPQHIKDESIAVRRSIKAELSAENSLLVKAMPPAVFGPGLRLEGKLSNGVQATVTVEALNVAARVFQPPQEHLDRYMNAAVTHPGVQRFMRKHHFSKSLFLIVGVSTASKLTVRESPAREAEASGAAGVAATVEGGISHTETRSATSELEIEEECDFAYRLREFSCWKYKTGAADKGDVSRGALFGRRDGDDESETSDDEEAFVAKFNAFRGEDDFSGGPDTPSF